MVLKYFGQLCTAMACLTLVPLGVSLLFGDFHVSLRYLVVIVCVSLTGFVLLRLKSSERIQTNEAMVVTALIFVVSPLVLAWPVMAAGFGFLDAFFETVSAVTTTGLSTAVNLNEKPATFLFARAWMQWVGGLGIVVLSIAAMIQPGLAAKRLDLEEDYENDLIGSTRAYARRVFAIYAILTVAGFLLLIGSGSEWFESILYALAAVSTGGFSPDDASLQGIANHYAQFAVIFISMAGGVSLALYHRAYRHGVGVAIRDRQFQGFLAAGVLATLLLTWFLWYQDGFDWPDALRHGALNALSAQSTAGFASLDISKIGDGAKLALIFAMAVGGSIGSTAGGIKIFRLLIVFRLLYLIIQRSGAPSNAVSETRLSGRRIEIDEIQTALSLIAGFILIIAISWLPFIALGHAPLNSLFEVVSALGTAGISAGVTSAELHPMLKAVLCADMLLGRLEIVVWMVFLYPGTWIGKRREG
jgi:trk system potassium uptake protein TrkH